MAKRLDETFDELYRRYARLVYGYALQLCRNPSVAEDIVQTTFLKAIEHADSFEGKCEVSTWLCQIAKNTWYDLCKKAERQNVSMEQLMEQQGDGSLVGADSGEADILQGLVSREERTSIYRRVHMLPEPYREVLLLRIMGCLSFREIGEVFGRSETWGRVTFFRAKERLRDQIGDD